MHLPLCLCIMLVLYVLVQCLFSCLNILYVCPCQHHLRLKTPRGQGPCLFNSFCTVPRIEPCTDRCLKIAFWWWLASLSGLSRPQLSQHMVLGSTSGHFGLFYRAPEYNGIGTTCSTGASIWLNSLLKKNFLKKVLIIWSQVNKCGFHWGHEIISQQPTQLKVCGNPHGTVKSFNSFPSIQHCF